MIFNNGKKIRLKQLIKVYISYKKVATASRSLAALTLSEPEGELKTLE